MFERILNSAIIRGNTAAGVSVSLLADGGIECSYIILRRKKTIIDRIKEESGITDFKILAEAIPSNTPICLNIDGKGVIHKKVSISKEQHSQSIIGQILPNATSEEFFIDAILTGESSAYASVVRNNIVEEISGHFKELKRNVVSVNMGPFSITEILPLLDLSENFIHINEYQLEISNNTIIGFSKNANGINQNYTIGKENIRQQFILPFASAFIYLTTQTKQENLPPIVKLQQEEFFYKRLFSFSGWVALIFLFSLLLINFLLFDHYSKKSNELSANINLNTGLLQQLDTLTKELKFKEDFIEQTGILSNSRLSFYSDRVASTLLDKIQLTDLSINPLEKKLKSNQEPEFNKNKVYVSGITSNSTIINEWIKTLIKEDWVKEINIKNYNQDNANSNGEFKIEIVIKN